MSTSTTRQLTCRSGSLRGQKFNIVGKVTTGRDAGCDLIIDDPKVSRHHGTFSLKDGDVHYEDKGSTNGSLLNGHTVSECVICPGDVLKLGGCEFTIGGDGDHNSINFVSSSETMFTSVVNTGVFKADALADKFSQIFDYYREHSPETNPIEQVELVKTQRLLNGLKSIYSMSQSMTRLAPIESLLKSIGDNLFDLFAGAENLVILLWDEENESMAPREARNRDSDRPPDITISETVLQRAIEERSTLVAGDTAADNRFAQSESIIGFSVKSVICAPLISADKVYGAIYLDNREINIQYDDLDAEILSAFANQCAIAIENSYLCDNLQQSYHQTLQTLINAIEAKDSYTMGHTARVSTYSVGIGAEMSLGDARLERLKLAADLHDIGKIGIKEGIINKTGQLTDTEYVTIKDHVEIGEKILSPITYLQDVLPFIRGHHEKWDGSGYPDGLKGEECPLEGRIIALADAFDAMTSQRSYNKPLTFEQAAQRINESSGSHFDPGVVKAFDRYLRKVLLSPDAVRPDPVTAPHASPR